MSSKNSDYSNTNFLLVDSTITITKIKRLKLDFEKIKCNQKDIVETYKIFSNQKLLIFVSSGRVFTLDPNSLPSGKSNPKSFIHFIDVGTNEKMVSIILPDEDKKCVYCVGSFFFGIR